MTQKQTAIAGIEKREGTKEERKALFIKWIDENVKVNSLVNQDTVDWWQGVRKETIKL